MRLTWKEFVNRKRVGRTFFGPPRAPVFMTRAEEDLVVRMWFDEGCSGWEIARALERGLWGAHNIYIAVRKLAKQRGLERPKRNTHAFKYDWELVHALREEGMAWADIAAHFDGNPTKIKSLYHEHRNRGRFDG